MAAETATQAAPSTDPSALIPLDCRALNAESQAEAARWLEAVADSGNEYAQLLYANNPTSILGPPPEWIKHPEKVQAYKAKAMRYLTTSAANGNTDAWAALSATYGSGMLAPQDDVRAYAYYRALQMVNPDFAAQRRLDHLRSRLTEAQHSQSETLARKIYAGKN